MKPTQYCYVTVVLVSSLMARASSCDEIAVAMSPVKESFLQAEPVAIEMALTNVGTRDISVPFGYPDDLGVSFSCDDANAVPAPKESLFRAWRRTITKLSPGQQRQTTFALDRFLRFKRSGRYVVKYLAQHEDLPWARKPTYRVHRSTGEFTVMIREGELPGSFIQALSEGLSGDDARRQREAAELMLWVRDERIVPKLLVAVERFPDMGDDAVAALARLPLTEVVRAGLFQAVLKGESEACRPFFKLAGHGQIAIPDAEYQRLLRQGNIGKHYEILTHLRSHGDASHARLVEFLTKSRAPAIAKLATEVVAELRQGKKGVRAE